MWQPGVGNPESGSRFPTEVPGMRASGYGPPEAGREKYQRVDKKKYKRKGKGNGYEKNIIAALFWDRYQKEIFLTMYNNII